MRTCEGMLKATQAQTRRTRAEATSLLPFLIFLYSYKIKINMSELFGNKYRIESARLQNWDYASEGGYFITICTQDRECYFGDIANAKMRLSKIGQIAKYEWLKTLKIRKNVLLDEFIIMPNHIHGIIIICNNDNPVETCRGTSLRLPPKSLSSIINHFKGSVKRWCNKNKFQYFQWQPRFYDHIIRNQKSLHRIKKYIINNPQKWQFDRNNPASWINNGR